ncbi:glycoside hydrolase family 5 protein [Vararia minispora EC-137]|uniref:Glycoside hydrolase family 5 protein n=1 Tax=Vararia minispora EC-137 TaxID=1314806 RepID=A0ACB8QHJ8_9AGAM|nr:glycoside hydrolase family 5 protein [Vararia minispora EC-137]
MSFLKVQGSSIYEDVSPPREVVLRGAGLGGWMENFISGFPGCEFQIREALADTLGPEKSEFFFDKARPLFIFLEHFFTESDAIFFRSLSLNCIRIALNYRHFEDPMNPRILRANAFRHLDRAISFCAAQEIYTILDLHCAPGGQNGGWHSDHGTHVAGFWRHKHFQDSAVWLWERLAERYRDQRWVAGYNILNEPADPHPRAERLIAFYDRVIHAIRAIDSRHILFLDGNTYAADFSAFPEDVTARWGENVAYAIHDYCVFGFPKGGIYEATEEQKEKIRRGYARKRVWMDERKLCVWNGEWGPVYARREYEGKDTDEINERRYAVLRDQLQLYEQASLWSIWLYKDIGFQGMVYVKPSTPYLTLLAPLLHKKYRLAVDTWGSDDSRPSVKEVYQPIEDLIKEAIPNEKDRRLYPWPNWTYEKRVAILARATLVAEYLIKEWAGYFRGMDKEELEELAQSFRFENCVQREGLNEILRAHSC